MTSDKAHTELPSTHQPGDADAAPAPDSDQRPTHDPSTKADPARREDSDQPSTLGRPATDDPGKQATPDRSRAEPPLESDADRARKLFAELDPLLDADAELARRVARGLELAKHVPRPSNRRAPAVLDPFAIHRDDPSRLVPALRELDTERLKDVVSQYAMDPRRLALRWKSPERLIDLIVNVVEQRARKGDAFRSGAASP